MPDPELTLQPLICELDGAFIKTNLRTERLIHRFKHSLQRALSSRIDRQQLARQDLAASGPALPINEALFKFLQQQKSRGQPLVLSTSESPESVIEMLADKNIFDKIIGKLNADQLRAEFGKFDYIGTQGSEPFIWAAAGKRYVVESSNKTSQQLEKQDIPTTASFSTPDANLKSAFKSLRAYQWLKNLLVFVPIITSQQLNDANALTNSLIVFICFSCVASFGYIVNDLLDLQSDRAHPVKHKRPFASGTLTAQHGFSISAVLLLIALIGCSFLPLSAAIALAFYLLLTVTYSVYLKTKLMIDVVALGSLFTLRVIGGGAAIDTELSFYLLSFSIFIFSSLGMVKRFAELHNLQQQNKLTARGRGYRVEDIEPVRTIGISLGYMSVFVLGQYINSPVVTQYYDNPKFIWFLFPLLTFWLGRLWLLANRGEVNEDPLIFAVKDTTSLLVVAASAVILMMAN